MTKICTACKIEKPISEFYDHKVNGYIYPKPNCKKCHNKKRCERITPAQKVKRQNDKNIRDRNDRATLPSKPRFVKADATRSDSKVDWTNDLTLKFVKNLIKDGCSYCGVDRMTAKMSLDRIDNSLPHNQNNVNSSCMECNLTRGSMPFEAWLEVAKGVRSAREKGLLDGWNRRA
jgi:hypothetical protein